MAEMPCDVHRIKGMVDVEGAPQLLQAVGRRWTLSRPTAGLPPALVIIGTRGFAVAARGWLDAFEAAME